MSVPPNSRMFLDGYSEMIQIFVFSMIICRFKLKMSDCEATFFDDVKNVDWFFLNSGKSKGNSNALRVCFLMPA